MGLFDHRGTLDNLIGAQAAALRPYRLEGSGLRFAKGIEPQELLS
jgi:hypothetical protein